MIFRPLLLLISVLFISACSTLEFPGVYKLQIDQGNIITQDMINELQPGMSKSQVEFIMGTALVRDTFNTDRWDYLYSVHNSDGSVEKQRLSVFFQNDTLVRFMTTVRPDRVKDPEAQATPQRRVRR